MLERTSWQATPLTEDVITPWWIGSREKGTEQETPKDASSMRTPPLKVSKSSQNNVTWRLLKSFHIQTTHSTSNLQRHCHFTLQNGFSLCTIICNASIISTLFNHLNTVFSNIQDKFLVISKIKTSYILPRYNDNE